MQAIPIVMATSLVAATGLAAAVDPDRHTGEKLGDKTLHQPT